MMSFSQAPRPAAVSAGLAANIPGAVLFGLVMAVVSCLFIRWLARRGRARGPRSSVFEIFAPVLAFAAIVGVTWVAGNDHRTPAAQLAAPRTTPPQVVIVHPPASHPLLSGADIVAIVAILAAAVVVIIVSLGVNKIIHRRS